MAPASTLLLVLFIAMAATLPITASSDLQAAVALVSQAKAFYASTHRQYLQAAGMSSDGANRRLSGALSDCAEMYSEAEPRLQTLAGGGGDAGVWLSAALTNHRMCLDGLKESGGGVEMVDRTAAGNLTAVLRDALNRLCIKKQKPHHHASTKELRGSPQADQYEGILKTWDPANSKADIVVAKDGSGTFTTINAAIASLPSKLKGTPGRRVVIYVKAGIYNEYVVLKKSNIMLVGDGIDSTIITGHRNYVDGHTTVSSATFSVSGDGFWARDITFENTAGPAKHQAVAIRVGSDQSLFYRCGFRGYQDTLYAHTNRQFYRECQISGTVDFIFGNAAAVFQNCDIFVRRPMDSQSSMMITAQSRDDEGEPTGFSIHGARVRPAQDLAATGSRFRTFLGRPWRRYSRVVVMKSDLDGIIDPRGWTEWEGSYGLATLYYGEYGNVGKGAKTEGRVKWAGFHVLRSDDDARPFAVKNLIDGGRWIPGSGVPVSMDI